MRRFSIAAASIFLIQCSAAPPDTASESAPAPRPASKKSDAVSRADRLIADAAKREAEYQQTLKDEKERKAGVPIYNQYVVQGNILEGELPEPTPGRDQAWWRAQLQELRRRVNHNGTLLRQAQEHLDVARAQLKSGQGDAPTARLALRDAEAEYERIQKAFYRDSDWMAHMREKAQEWGVPKEWWLY